MADLGVLPCGRQPIRHGLGQFPDSATVDGRQRTVFIETQGGELVCRVQRRPVHLVDRHHHGLAAFAQVAGDVNVARQESLAGVNDQHGDIGLVDGEPGLGGHLLEDVAGPVGEAAGVDDRDAPAGEGGATVAAVAGESRVVRDQRRASAAKAIEQR